MTRELALRRLVNINSQLGTETELKPFGLKSLVRAKDYSPESEMTQPNVGLQEALSCRRAA